MKIEGLIIALIILMFVFHGKVDAQNRKRPLSSFLPKIEFKKQQKCKSIKSKTYLRKMRQQRNNDKMRIAEIRDKRKRARKEEKICIRFK